MARTVKQGKFWVGGYHTLPAAKNPSTLTRYGYSKAGSTYLERGYHNEHYMRTGKYGNPSDAKVHRSHVRKQLAGALGSAAGYGVATASAAHHPQIAETAGALSIGSSTYSLVHDYKADKLMNKKTGTRRSALIGFRPGKKK